jgi:hypothetical protein
MLRTDVQPCCGGSNADYLVPVFAPATVSKRLLSFYCRVSCADHSMSSLAAFSKTLI